MRTVRSSNSSSQFQFEFAVPVQIYAKIDSKPLKGTPSYPKLIRNRPRGLPETFQGTQEPTRHPLEPPLCAPEHSQGDPGMLGESPGVLLGAKKNA